MLLLCLVANPAGKKKVKPKFLSLYVHFFASMMGVKLELGGELTQYA